MSSHSKPASVEVQRQIGKNRIFSPPTASSSEPQRRDTITATANHLRATKHVRVGQALQAGGHHVPEMDFRGRGVLCENAAT